MRAPLDPVDGSQPRAVDPAVVLVGRPEPIGFLQLALIEPEHRRWRPGIVIGLKDLWGGGYGTLYAFGRLRLMRITAEA